MNCKENIGIIIPSFEPDDKLLTLLKNLNSANFKNIIIVDDGSGDNYSHYFKEAYDKYGCVVLKHNVNQGKGRALKTSFNYILNERDDLVGGITVDSDGQHKIKDIEKCYEAFCENPDKLIMGCRDFLSKNSTVPFRSKFGNVMTHKVLKMFCGINLSDTQTGLRCMSKKLMKTFLKTDGERFEYEMHMILDASEKKIELLEVPIETIYICENETSHFNPLVDSIRIYAVFSKFILSSISSFLIDVILFTILVSCLKNIVPAYIVIATYSARVISALFNYLINKNKVFKSNAKNSTTLVKYFILCVIQVTLSALLTSTLFHLTLINVTFIKIVVDAILFLISFRIQRGWVFKEKQSNVKK